MKNITRFEIYDLAAGRWGSEVAVVMIGPRRIVGIWKPIAHCIGDFVLRSSRPQDKAVEVLASGETWDEVAEQLGFFRWKILDDGVLECSICGAKTGPTRAPAEAPAYASPKSHVPSCPVPNVLSRDSKPEESRG